MKKCKGCGRLKEVTSEFFYRDKRVKSGFRSKCKDCIKLYNSCVSQEHKEYAGTKKCTKCRKVKEHTSEFFHRANREKSGFRSKCKECIKEEGKKYHSKPEVKARMKEYINVPENKQRHSENRNKPEVKERAKKVQKLYSQKPEVIIKRNEWLRNARKTNPLKRIQHSMGNNFCKNLKNLNTSKPKGTMMYVGCTREELIENFNCGEYTMEDYMKNANKETIFDCDHIIPSKYFMDKIRTDENNKVTKETEPWLYKWWNYRNLRIWPSSPNRSKSDDMDYDLIDKHGIRDLLTL
jgi:hypothetical protein